MNKTPKSSPLADLYSMTDSGSLYFEGAGFAVTVKYGRVPRRYDFEGYH